MFKISNNKMSFTRGDNPSNRSVRQDFSSRGTVNAEELQVSGNQVGAVRTVTLTSDDIDDDYTFSEDLDIRFHVNGNLVTVVIPAFTVTAGASAVGSLQFTDAIPSDLIPPTNSYGGEAYMTNDGVAETMAATVFANSKTIRMLRRTSTNYTPSPAGFATGNGDVITTEVSGSNSIIFSYETS